jgi:hypothetical protein
LNEKSKNEALFMSNPPVLVRYPAPTTKQKTPLPRPSDALDARLLGEEEQLGHVQPVTKQRSKASGGLVVESVRNEEMNENK